MRLPLRWKQVVWDWNGTLIDDVRLCLDIINGLLQKYEKPQLTLEKYHEVFDFPIREYYRRIGFDSEKTPFEVVGTEFMHQYWQKWKSCPLHNGALHLAETLHAQGLKQSIISAAETRLLKSGVEHFNMSHLFDELLGLNHHYATSKEDLVVEFVATAKVAPDEIIFIGDTLHDYAVAQNAGIECILFSGGHHSLQKLKQCGAPVFETFDDIQTFFAQA